MASKKTVVDLLECEPILDERPEGAMTIKEMAELKKVSRSVIHREIERLNQQGLIRQARLRVRTKTNKASYTYVYWLR